MSGCVGTPASSAESMGHTAISVISQAAQSVRSTRTRLIRGEARGSDTSVFSLLCRTFQLRGSVFPQALFIALPCALFTALIKLAMNIGVINLDGSDAPLKEYAAWSGFSFLVGFLIVFRTSQAYSRFWDGCTSTHAMRAEWFDACSALVAFCKHSKAEGSRIVTFQNVLVRLFSILHALALAEIEDSEGMELEDVEAFHFELIDVRGIDDQSLMSLQVCDCKVELVFQWIQQLIVENINLGVLSIPAPILSRSFQELANGMVQFHEAQKISQIPFPFPYAQTCNCLLIIHWTISPFVVSQWVYHPMWAAVFTFTQVFILWALNFIAVEIENPFGQDENDLDGRQMQVEMNKHLMVLLSPEAMRLPQLSAHALIGTRLSHCSFGSETNGRMLRSNVGAGRMTLIQAWRAIDVQDIDARRPSITSAGTSPSRASHIRRNSLGSRLNRMQSSTSALSMNVVPEGTASEEMGSFAFVDSGTASSGTASSLAHRFSSDCSAKAQGGEWGQTPVAIQPLELPWSSQRSSASGPPLPRRVEELRRCDDVPMHTTPGLQNAHLGRRRHFTPPCTERPEGVDGSSPSAQSRPPRVRGDELPAVKVPEQDIANVSSLCAAVPQAHAPVGPVTGKAASACNLQNGHQDGRTSTV